ncbi:sugar phosphate isomerase/epimerase family protein [Eudoraea chungangensis]|uniref:sugar phosphate isomerase/epimerase family protein n=1 Tax=Eudoraea chungangensis TaxID=1481905 RepID=UPI0023EDCC6E|nr:sugar phosphate isomerase/epimerase [Eudoraea chungangensis]
MKKIIQKSISRRKAIQSGLLLTMGSITSTFYGSELKSLGRPSKERRDLPFRISLNTSTLIHYNLGVDEQIRMVAKAGFDGVELWMRDIMTYLSNGGTASELKSLLESNNLLLENIIGFSKWCSDKEEERDEALEQLKKEMSIIAEMGGKFIAAPVQGIDAINPDKYQEYAKRYRRILDLGDSTGVTPILELWGMGALNKVADCAQIAISSGHPKAKILLDFYHVYRGGNSWETIDFLNGAILPVMHMNDYPASPSFNKLNDGDRVLPGEGICDYNSIIPKMYEAGFRGGFSVELFNKGYWESMDAETMLKESYEKSLKVLSTAMNI